MNNDLRGYTCEMQLGEAFDPYACSLPVVVLWNGVTPLCEKHWIDVRNGEV